MQKVQIYPYKKFWDFRAEIFQISFIRPFANCDVKNRELKNVNLSVCPNLSNLVIILRCSK